MPESEDRKAYRREWMKRDYERNPEKYRQRANAKHARNRDKYLPQMKVYREKNSERIKERQKEWRAANKPALRRNNLKRIGFTPELVDELIAIQNGRCAICDIPLADLPKKHIHSDHCHETNTARGILCHSCNVGIGLFKDDTTLLQKAVKYLENPPINAWRLK